MYRFIISFIIIDYNIIFIILYSKNQCKNFSVYNTV